MHLQQPSIQVIEILVGRHERQSGNHRRSRDPNVVLPHRDSNAGCLNSPVSAHNRRSRHIDRNELGERLLTVAFFSSPHPFRSTSTQSSA
jgi:hypothetical protein